jgi:hypothetical protein
MLQVLNGDCISMVLDEVALHVNSAGTCDSITQQEIHAIGIHIRVKALVAEVIQIHLLGMSNRYSECIQDFKVPAQRQPSVPLPVVSCSIAAHCRAIVRLPSAIGRKPVTTTKAFCEGALSVCVIRSIAQQGRPLV